MSRKFERISSRGARRAPSCSRKCTGSDPIEMRSWPRISGAPTVSPDHTRAALVDRACSTLTATLPSPLTRRGTMVIKHLAVSAAAAAATLIAAPAFSQEFRAPMTTFFVAVPLDARSHKEFTPNFGLQFQGSRPYQAVRVDYQTFK